MDDNTKLAALLLLMPIGVMIMVLAIVVGLPDVPTGTWLLIIAGGLAVISVIMMAGRGAWAVAGYNTLSAEEKSKYDPKKVARGCGFIMLGTAVLMALSTVGTIGVIIGIIALVISIFVGIYYMNRNAKLSAIV